MINGEGNLSEQKFSLQEYFSKYLTEIRGLKKASVNHYMEGLDSTVSRYLAQHGLVQKSIFEIRTIEDLQEIKRILLKDKDFHDMDERGHRMYSAAFNRYMDFADGEWIKAYQNGSEELEKFDEPFPVKEYRLIDQEKRRARSYIIKKQVEEASHYLCEFNHDHQTFIVNKTDHQYMEGHHAIPLFKQDSFQNSLDVYANVVCLCPICHRLLHYGRQSDKEVVLNKIYHDRGERLAKCGIYLSKSEFVKIACR